MTDFTLVYESIPNAKAIAWDTCHKIYVLMDDEQVEKTRGYGYDPLITKDEMSDDEMFETVKAWYEDSCGLRFVQAVSTNPEDPNLGYEDLISQFEEEDCEDCGETGCAGVCNDEDEDDE